MLVRFAGLFRRKRREREMNDELRARLDGLFERDIAAGMSPDEACHVALRDFGGIAQIKECARDERRTACAEQVLQAVRYATGSCEISEAENRGVRADAQRERGHDDHGETGF